MKTAQQYAEEYCSSSNQTAKLGEIAVAIMNEVAEIGKSRRLATNESLFALFDQQDQKWREFASRAPGVNPGGFAKLLEAKMPEIYAEWMRSKAGKI